MEISYRGGGVGTERGMMRSGFVGGVAATASGKGITKKRPRLGRVAESFQSRLSASFGVVRRRDGGTVGLLSATSSR
jgi:hypothetical protein